MLELTGAYFGYIDAYMKQAGLTRCQPYALLKDERLGRPEALAAAYGRTADLDAETSNMIERARAKGAADYAAVMKVLTVSERAD